jgi:myo-inositol 2-dehydrogenase/D-chiro-inositol 1-dehydrogenase
MKQLKIGLLGMGRIGKIHFRNIQQYFSNTATVVAVADPVLDISAYQSQYPSVYFTKEAKEVVLHQEVEAILICTPTSSHAELLELAIEAGKNIFCEKPMDLSLERTKALAQLAEEANIKLMMGFNRRFDPDFLQAKKSVNEGKVGDVQIVKITSRDPGLPPVDYIKNSGGLFMDMAIHDFDMARYMMNKKVVEVFAKGAVRVDEAVAAAGDIDTALTTLTFEDGTYAVIDNSRKAIYGYDQRIEIFGSEGMIQVDNNQHNRNILFNASGIHHALPLDFFMDRYAKSYLNEIQFFISALADNTAMPVGGEDALESTRIAFAAKKSMLEGRPVKLSEID